MSLSVWLAVAVSCAVFEPDAVACVRKEMTPAFAETAMASKQGKPEFTGQSLDVVLSSKATLVWDVKTGAVLYERNASVRRPVASLSKLASVWFVREKISPEKIIAIPEAAARVARKGADITLPIGQHVAAQELFEASLIASANDAMVSLAVAASGSEENFVREVNAALAKAGIVDTKLVNATGLEGGQQYSTAQDIRRLLIDLYTDAQIRPLLAAERGVLTTQERQRRVYVSTNKLLNTYVTVLAAKTGYTLEAGENLALITRTDSGHEIGAIVLGSNQRFQDMKALVEWIERNYSWP